MWNYLTSAKSGKNLVIKPYHPFYRLILWIVICVSFGTVIYLICLSELNMLARSCFSSNTDQERLQALNAELTSQNNRLREHVVILERAMQVDHIAYEEINKTMESLQDEIREAREELIFYQELVASSDQEKEFTIQSFVLQPGDVEHAYHYRMVLTRFQKDDKVSRGTMDLSVIGKQEGKPRRLGLSDMMVKGSRRLSFRFRNFQKLEGYLILPTGFMPHQIVVTAHLREKKMREITKVVDWPSAIN